MKFLFVCLFVYFIQFISNEISAFPLQKFALWKKAVVRLTETFFCRISQSYCQ